MNGTTFQKSTNILAITNDEGPIAELRLLNPLRALQRAGFITSFKVITERSIDKIKNDETLFNRILVQRTVSSFFFITLKELDLVYSLDVDDNLLAKAAYRDSGVEEDILLGLNGCHSLITPNSRLVKLLEKYSKNELSHKSKIVPNALPYPNNCNFKISQPKQIIWIQSDISALTNSKNEIIRAVSTFSEEYNLSILLIGPSVLKNLVLPNQVVMGEIDFVSNLQLLEYSNTSIGIAPLETCADDETLDFIAGKSDLKMLLFSGFGHPAIYSNSPPYFDTPLRNVGSLVDNSYESWYQALDYQFREGWKKIGISANFIQNERHINRIAIEYWLPAIDSCLLKEPVSGKTIYEAFIQRRNMLNSKSDMIHVDIRQNFFGLYIKNFKEKNAIRKQINYIKNSKFFNSEWYLSQNPDVASLGLDPVEHFCNNGWKEFRNPGPEFSLFQYIQLHPELSDLKENPLVHYERIGKYEKNQPFK